ncbi:hybrid sensor histidine kinase/response regulator transcription factor [Arenibacter latericius]|uniref:hybrid sensor histidine kinase/response regulator transcription factor n=1 Tax=Arenibacter latericius TaxID=86104 RepID=UPI000422B786|nr:hybrid sensor histidine kinase/response regulator transcription factor [Arenibacter latericius]
MNLRKLLLVFIPVLLLAGNSSKAQFINYSTKGGLSSNNIEHISEDEDGLIYISSYNGLNIFNGTDFQVLNQYNKESFSSEISGVLPLNNGYVLIGTLDKGLFLLDKFKQDIIPLKLSSIPLNASFAVTTLFLDEGKNVWIGLKDGQIITFKSSEITSHTSSTGKVMSSLVSTASFAINSFIEANNSILAAGNGSKVIRIKKEHTNFIIDYPLEFRNVYQIFSMVAINNSLFIGTNSGLYKTKILQYQHQTIPTSIATPWKLPNSIIRSISLHKDKLWVGTEGDGLYNYSLDGRELGHFTYQENKRNSINSNYALFTMVDSNDNLWVGTWFGGINLLNLNESKFQFIYDSKSEINLFANIIWNIATTPEGDLYLGTHGNGLCIYQPAEENFISILNETEVKSVSALYYDPDKKLLFIGTWEHGIKVFDPATGVLVEKGYNFDALASERIYTITKGPDNKLWIGSFNKGLYTYSFKNHQLEKFELSDKTFLADTDIRCLLTDIERNQLWVGSTKNGLFSIQFREGVAQKTIHHPNFKGSNQKIIAENLYKDSLDNIWVLCRNGIGKIDSDQTPYKLPILSGAITTGMIEDDQQRFWISTYKGIYVYDPSTQITTPFLKEHTFSDLNFIPKEKLVFAASDNGLLISQSDTSVERPHLPNIYFSQLKILDQKIKPLESYRGTTILPRHLNYSDTLQLPYYSQTFSIDINAISFIEKSKDQIRYRLKNFETGWNISGSLSTTASYTNVPPGAYTLEVQTSNLKGGWESNNFRAITIIKHRPWWVTPWAFTTYLILLFTFIYFVYREIRGRIRIKQELKIEKIKQEREFEIYQQKMSFFTNISHDIRTPLTLILGPLEEILTTHALEKEVESKLQRMLKNTKILFSLVNQILDFRKAEANNIQLDLRRIELNSFVQNIHYQFSGLAQNKEVDLDISSPEDKIWIVADPQKLESVFFNLLSNAIKFTPKYGQIMIHFNQDEKQTLIVVKDTGVGIPEDELENIFTRFYRSKNNHQFPGTGIGVALVKKYIDLHNGHIEVKSTENLGSEFIIHLPLLPNQDVYPEYDSYNEMDVNPASKKAETKNSSKKATVLVIDDNYDIRDYLREILQQDYHVLEAENGTLGLSITNKRLPDLVISDVMMEGMDGLEVCDRIKTNLNTSHIPVILLTAKNTVDTKIEGFEKGSDAYLEKPFNSKLLLTMVKNLIEHREAMKKKFLLSTSVSEQSTPSSVDEEFIEKVIGTIDKHISESDFSVQDLAEKLLMSPDQLYRKIRVLTGLSAIHFIRLIRLKRAANLLLDKRYAVNEIVYMVGFNNPSYFTRCFKAEYGVPPSEYLQSQEVNHE